MDAARLDVLVRKLAARVSRRHGLSLLAALGLSQFTTPEGGDAKKKRKKRCPPCKKRKKGKCKATLPDGTACPGGACQQGACVASPVPPPPSPPGPSVKPDASCPGPADSASASSGNTRFAQTFTAIASGPLVRADLRISKANNSLGDYILRLSAVDASAEPTNTVLASALLPNDDVPSGSSTVSFAFPMPFSVVAGVQYALVITRPGANQLQTNGYGNDTCTGGAFHSPDQDNPFAPSATLSDLVFATFVMS